MASYKMKKYCKRNTFILIVISMLIIILTGIVTTNNSIWGDEGYTIRLIKGSFSELIRETSIDVHPPLYYIIAKIISDIFGYSIPLLKIISLVPVSILLAIASTKIQKEFGFLTALTFIMLVGLQPSMVYHIEIRMYSWAMFFVTLCALFIYNVMQENKNSSWWGMVVAGLAAAYTHYYALITVAFLYVSLFIIMVIRERNNWKKCFFYSAITIVGYLPWLFILIGQFRSVSKSYWIEPITFSTVVDYIWFTIGSERSMWVLVIGLMVTTIIFLLKGEKCSIMNHKKLMVIICFVGFLGNIGLGMTVSFLIKPLFYARYIFVAIGLLWLGLSITLSREFKRNKMVVAIFSILLLIAGSFHYINFYTKEKILEENTTLTEKFVYDHILVNDKIVTNKSHFSWTVLEVYFPENEILPYEEMNWIKNEECVWIFSETKELSIEEELEEANYSIKYIMEGRIDSDVYYLYQLEKK